jgi:hypothetical protein
MATILLWGLAGIGLWFVIRFILSFRSVRHRALSTPVCERCGTWMAQNERLMFSRLDPPTELIVCLKCHAELGRGAR